VKNEYKKIEQNNIKKIFKITFILKINIIEIDFKMCMNVIFITIDGARADRILNSKVFTDVIKKSSFFSRVIAYAPFTIAAMHAVFTGSYGTHTGVNSYWSSPNFKKNEYKLLSTYLHDSNYITIGDSINKLILPNIGFDELTIHDELSDDLTKRHCNLIDKVYDLKNNNKKFFLYLHYSNIHTGIMEEVLKKYNDFSEEYFSNIKKNEKFYDKLFNNAEDYLKIILDHINHLKLDKDTLIVIISDHGISVGEKIGERAYGVFCYDYTLTSTVLFHHHSLSHIHVKNQVRSIDILPTILDILQISEDQNYKKIQGKSLITLINGKSESRVAFSQSGNPLDTGKPPKKPNISSIRTDNWKFIKNLYNNTEELYNLINDPNEQNNIIKLEKETAEKLRVQLLDHLDSS